MLPYCVKTNQYGPSPHPHYGSSHDAYNEEEEADEESEEGTANPFGLWCERVNRRAVNQHDCVQSAAYGCVPVN